MARVTGYLDDFITAVQKTYELTVPRLWLVAMSGSGSLSFRIATAKPQALRGLVVITSSAGNLEELVFPTSFPILMINGTRDVSYPIDDARAEYLALRARGVTMKMAELEADHYLFLSRPQDLRTIIETFRQEHSANNGAN